MSGTVELPREVRGKMDSFLSLTRYFAWSEVMRRELFRYNRLEATRTEKDQVYLGSEDFAAGAYIAYWFAALYVVVEGWEELSLADPDIDGHLRDPHRAVLRRFRNGVFHFQKDWHDDRFLSFIDDVEGAQIRVGPVRRPLKR